ncbi:MAG: methyltransferase [Acidobacteria bacterium]|nr:methyltransferase [Acidobacteriota bacterium]
MTSRQRVQAALERRPADRVPVFMWFHPETACNLARRLEIHPSDVGHAMGNDISQTWVNNNYAMEGIQHGHDGEGHTDDWGIRWVKRFFFNQIESHPLKGAGAETVSAYRFPYHRMEALLDLMKPVLAQRGELFIGCDVSPCVFEMYWRLRGMEDSMLDMAERPALADEMLGKCADFSIALGEAACTRYSLDWYWTGDDVAGQRCMMMSPKQWRALIRPHLERVFEVGRRHGLPIAYHCCGALRPIIGDLVEMGLAVLNPIQSNCPGMAAPELKQEFGDRLTFMGGVDTQELLPNASAAEVARATSSLIETMTRGGGGYILAASHTIPPETPEENIWAMYEVAGITREEVFDRAAQIRRQKASL